MVFIPLVLYLCDWSLLIVKPIANDFYLIVGLFFIFVSFTSWIEGKTQKIKKESVQLKNRYLIDLYTLFFIFCCFLENYILSGHILPALFGIDIHTDKVGGLMWITNSYFLPLALNYIGFYKTKQKRYIGYFLFIVFLPLFGKGSRLDIFMNLLQVALLWLFLRPTSFKPKKRIKGNFKALKRLLKFLLKICLVIAVLFFLAFLIILVGVYRSTGTLSTQSMYALSIDYVGPGTGFLKEVFAWSYGYFAFSFNNLNNNILNTWIEPNYIGLNSFKAFWFGLLHGSWFGLSSDAANNAKTIVTTSATTTTVFWDFYYDFYHLSFIPILITASFYLFLKKRAQKKSPKVGSILNYIYWCGLLLFISFNNTIFFDLVFINMIVNHIVCHFIFKSTIFETQDVGFIVRRKCHQ